MGSHSLQAGGAMALALNCYSEVQIKKMEKWKGETYGMYIHEQVAHFYKNMATNMATEVDFVNIECPTNP